MKYVYYNKDGIVKMICNSKITTDLEFITTNDIDKSKNYNIKDSKLAEVKNEIEEKKENIENIKDTIRTSKNFDELKTNLNTLLELLT